MQRRERGKERGGADEGTAMRGEGRRGECGGVGRGRGARSDWDGTRRPLSPGRRPGLGRGRLRRTVSLANHYWSFRVEDGA